MRRRPRRPIRAAATHALSAGAAPRDARPVLTRIATIACALLGTACAGVAQNPAPIPGIELASGLLAAAPFGPARAEQLEENAFLTRFHLVREGIPGLAGANVVTAGQAVTALEAYLADFGPVTARVTSEPEGLEITYRPVYEDRSDADPGVTSNRTVTLRLPIDYWFDARNPFTGATESKRRACQFGCGVHFVFTPPGTTRAP